MAGKLKFIAELVGESLFQPLRGTQHTPVLADRNELGITFIGHSSFLIQLGGLNLLVDPVFAMWLILLRRHRRAGVALRSLPPIDAVLLTHAHMDHLNLPSLRRIIRHTTKLSGKPPEVIVPSGVEDIVEKLGFSRITSMRWWQQHDLRGLKLTMTPASHWGARMFSDTHRGFGGYALEYGEHRVYHSGDTAYFDGFREIGARLAPQVALLPIGAYSPDNFRSVHTSPEDALQAFLDLKARAMIPMHFGTFKLSSEPMDEPLPRLLAAAESAGVRQSILPLAEGETRIVKQPRAEDTSAPLFTHV
ncbi:MBL fold metallo-hydrolase [Acidipila rosea]|uniref:L-ascorbate metabolism protein UlaG (Beta-lactamase superfamily) n=1 Tax=Acidipila rosea TaxID=768535 RepID=A0A4R1LBH9_9BACT|nr:MBL fold metallo-hydrolase [Acidipila rosea]TCK75828.1 L-ascorbate metabolism protein UlaG (beta-lactamase superfamily) [Acidipila rosea]